MPTDQDIFPGLLTPEQRRELSRNASSNSGGNGEQHQKPIEILTYGGGAMGALYSWIISLGPRPVTFTMICRSNYPTISTSGFTISSFLFGPGHFRPHHVLPDASILSSPTTTTPTPTREFDLIFVCTKSSGKVDIPAHLVTPQKTGIVLFQNGINIEAPYKLAFPENPIISAVLYVSCAQPEPGKIFHVGHIDIVKMGLYPDPAPGEPTNPALKLVTELLQGGGCNASSVPHIQSDRWLKTVWNGCWNVLCAVSGLDTHAFLASSPSARDAVRAVSREIVQVARRALGVVGPDGKLASEGQGEGEVAKEILELWGDEDATVERNLKMAEMAVPITPSMLQDARKGGEMEVEAFCGEVVRTGERLGVEMKVLKTLYPVLLAMNHRFKQTKL